MKPCFNANGKASVGVVRCSGNLSASQMVRLKSQILRLIKKKRRYLLLDLGHVQQMELAALGMLLHRIHEVRSLKGDVRLFNIRPDVQKLLEKVGATHVVETFGDEKEARKSFQLT